MTPAERPTGLYRSRDGMLLGVCKGIADYLDISLFWTRMLTVLFFLFSGFWPVGGLYLLAAMVMKPEPVVPFASTGEREFYDAYVNSRGLALHRLKHTFDHLDRRIQRMEDVVTNREYDWEQRLHKS